MKGKIITFVALLVLIFACTSGLIEPITKVFVWLITLQFNSPDISVFGQLVAKYGTWIITYTLVGIIFKELDLWDRDLMKIAYFILSTIISFLLSWLIMVLEKYMVIIAIIVGALTVVLITITLIRFIIERNNKHEETANNKN